jgi:hypothetical protein
MGCLTVETPAFVSRCDAPQHLGKGARRVLAKRAQGSFLAERSQAGSAGWANLWLYEMTAPSVSSFLECYLQSHLTRVYRIERSNSPCGDVAARPSYLHIKGISL